MSFYRPIRFPPDPSPNPPKKGKEFPGPSIPPGTPPVPLPTEPIIVTPYVPPTPKEPPLPPTLVDKWSNATLVVTHGKGKYHSVLKVNGMTVLDVTLPYEKMDQDWLNSWMGTMRFAATPIDEEPKP